MFTRFKSRFFLKRPYFARGSDSDNPIRIFIPDYYNYNIQLSFRIEVNLLNRRAPTKLLERSDKAEITDCHRMCVSKCHLHVVNL